MRSRLQYLQPLNFLVPQLADCDAWLVSEASDGALMGAKDWQGPQLASTTRIPARLAKKRLRNNDTGAAPIERTAKVSRTAGTARGVAGDGCGLVMLRARGVFF